VSSTTRPATGSVARVTLPNSTSGVEPENFDQLLPFQSHVAAFGARLVPHEDELTVVPFALAVAAGTGAISGIVVALGGSTPVFELDDPEDPDPEDPDPDEHAIGNSTPDGSEVPTRITSRVTGSYVIWASFNAGGDVVGCACVHAEPSQTQVSARFRDLF
jgi:hypothetical protein